MKNVTVITQSTNIQLFNTNRPKNSSLLAQITSLTNTTILDTESIVNLDVKGDVDEEVNDPKFLLALFATESKVTNQRKSAKYQSNKSDLQKHANLPDEFFDYIYCALYRRLFSLAWYNDMTYAINKITGFGIDLPTSCCNRFNYKNTEPEFLQRELFINIAPTKYSKSDREWITYQTATLKTWKKETSKYL